MAMLAKPAVIAVAVKMTVSAKQVKVVSAKRVKMVELCSTYQSLS
jgi:hypothetical protein